VVVLKVKVFSLSIEKVWKMIFENAWKPFIERISSDQLVFTVLLERYCISFEERRFRFAAVCCAYESL